MRNVARRGVANCPKCRYVFDPNALQSVVQGGKGKGKGKVNPEEFEGGCLSFRTREGRTGSCSGEVDGAEAWVAGCVLMGSLAEFLVRLLQ